MKKQDDPKELRAKLRETKQRLNSARAFLLRLEQRRYHEPNSDWHEYCAGCGRSPYNVPPHKDDCLVVELAALLEILDGP